MLVVAASELGIGETDEPLGQVPQARRLCVLQSQDVMLVALTWPYAWPRL
jgi:hypothetical protein